MDAATRYILNSDADVAALFCEPNLASYYAGSGWQEMPNSVVAISGKGTIDPDKLLLMMLFVSEKGTAKRVEFEMRPLVFEEPW